MTDHSINNIDRLGLFPAPGPQARKDKKFYKLSEDGSIKMISGEKTPALISFWCSNDVVQFGTLTILSGGPSPQQTEYDEHKGDAVFCVLSGKVSFHLKKRKETYTLEPGDFMFIPEGETYKIINYYASTAKVIFSIAPEI
jgi:mannose-6-phosphate isomerase-like protein (cupin superfamily)